MKKIKFTLLNHVIVCGTKTDRNFLVSEDYITGAVVRAAFASSILLECPFAEEEIAGKKYFVAYRGEKCNHCDKADICKKFSEMKFSFLYPENSIPAPFTLRECKGFGTKHPVKDMIAENGRLFCGGMLEDNHLCGGRMETVKGFINVDTLAAVEVARSHSTHTEINEYTHTALGGSLFSIDSIRRGQIYEGYIDDCDTGLACVGQVIYCGKYSSNGYGKMEITEVSELPNASVAERIEQFNAKFSQSLKQRYQSPSRVYATLLFLSDAKLGLEDYDDHAPEASEAYRAEWQRRIFGADSPVKLEQIYAQNFIYAGFDTSRTDNQYDSHKKAQILTEKGTSVLLSFDEADRAAAISFLEAFTYRGIGSDVEIGYGHVEICSKLHMIGAESV